MRIFILITTMLLSYRSVSQVQEGVPEDNWAIYTGWTGKVDTEIDFKDFFKTDFNLVAWVMPQYIHAYAGPIFANNGEGIFMAGLGDYTWGIGGNQKITEGGDTITTQGPPVFFIQVGKTRATYLVPEFKVGGWVHVAVVRAKGKFQLFINNKHLFPKEMAGGEIVNANAPEITVGRDFDLRPRGKLRFGRGNYLREEGKEKLEYTKGKRYDIRDYQFYGLIDDVGLFEKALTSNAISALKYGSKRLDGFESYLEAGWIFDKNPGGLLLPTPLQQSWEKDGYLHHIKISKDRDSDEDNRWFSNFLIIGETSVPLKLPFAKDEAWKVTQGYDSKGGSHFGYAAFCYDFTLAEDDAAYANVLAAADAKVVDYSMDEEAAGPPSNQEENYIKLFLNRGEYLLYKHLDFNSQNGVVKNGDYNAATDSYTFPESSAPLIASEAYVAKLGAVAKHLHLSAVGGISYGATFPVAFSNYEVSEDEGKTWKFVLRGHPKYKQWIRRKQ